MIRVQDTGAITWVLPRVFSEGVTVVYNRDLKGIVAHTVSPRRPVYTATLFFVPGEGGKLDDNTAQQAMAEMAGTNSVRIGAKRIELWTDGRIEDEADGLKFVQLFLDRYETLVEARIKDLELRAKHGGPNAHKSKNRDKKYVNNPSGTR